MIKKGWFILLCSTMIMFSQAKECFAYSRSYSEYRAAKEREYQRYKEEKERSYRNNRNKSYSERRREYDSIYQKHANNNAAIYKQYHDSSSGGNSNSNSTYQPQVTQPNNANYGNESVNSIVTDITQSWIYGTWVQKDNPSVTLTIGSFSSTTFAGVQYVQGTTNDYGNVVVCNSYNISLEPRGLSNISSQFEKQADGSANVTITTSFTDMNGNSVVLGTCILNMIKQ